MSDPAAPTQEASPEPSLSRRQRERQQRRLAMLRAAQRVFAEKGYAHATLDEIAERAEFGKGTLYNYFEGGKEEILFSVFDEVYEGMHGLIQRFAADAEERPLREAFRALAREAFDFFLAHESLFMMLLKESHQFIFGDNQEHAVYFHTQEERLVETLLPVLEEAARTGAIRSLPTRPVARMMLENTKGILVARAMLDQQEARGEDCEDTILHHPDQAADMLTTILFDGLDANSTDVSTSDARS